LTQNNQESAEEDGGGRVPALSLDSPWAWFYYSTFAVQVAIVTAYMFREQAAVVTSNTALDTYISVLLEVSIGVPAMAAYSLLIAVTVEAIRMIAERYLAKRFRQGKREGMAQGKREGMALGKREGMAQGKREGMAQGKREGMALGITQGKREGMAGKREGMAQGKREGMAQGKREGMAEGMAQGKREGRQARRHGARQARRYGIGQA
jgi:hypothetical protein